METDQVSASLDNGTSSTWKYLFSDLADHRTDDWFLMNNPIPMLLIMISYLYFIKVCGPKYMKDKKPYQLKSILMVYNIIQIIYNVWLFKEGLKTWKYYNWNCQPIDRSRSPEAMRIVFACYMYFLNKITDLLDTVFFVLRKKDSQITFLHVFHHTFMVTGCWWAVRFIPGGHGTLIGTINSFVHILLYSYYFLAAFGPGVQKYLWWKRYLTRLQLIQFCIVFLHNMQLLYFDCGYPKYTVLLTLPNAIFFYYLFNDFYQKAYTKPHEQQIKGREGTVKNK